MGILDQAIVQLRRWHHCPACGSPLRRAVCDSCGLVLSGADGRLLREQSEAAARALELRERTLAQLMSATRPVSPRAVGALAGAAPAHPGSADATAAVSALAGFPPPGDIAATPLPPPDALGAPGMVPPRPTYPLIGPTVARTEINPVAVFSAVGVGALVAAALVLAFLVPADPGLIRIILLGVAVASVAATLTMRRRRPVSASAIATGAVLLCLLVIVLFTRWLSVETVLLATSLAAAGLGAGLGVAGFRLRLRPWVSAGLLLLPASAGVIGYDRGFDTWAGGTALVAAIALAAGGRWAARRWQGDRPGPLPFGVERVLLGVGAAFALFLALQAMLMLANNTEPTAPWATVLGLAAAVATWWHGSKAESPWRWVAGMVAVLVPAWLAMSLAADSLVVVGSVSLGWLALAALSNLPPGRDGRWSGLLKGGWFAALAFALPAAGVLLAGLGVGREGRLGNVGPGRVLVPGWALPEAGYAVAGLLAAAAVCAVAAGLPPVRFGNRPEGADQPGDDPVPLPAVPLPAVRRSTRIGVRKMSGWLWPSLTLAGLTAAVSLPVLPLAASVALLLVLALACGLVVWRLGEQARPVRAVARIGGGLIIVVAAAASWDSAPLTLAAGVAVVALTLGWGRLVAPPARQILVGVGYGYALVLLSHALRWYPLGWDADDPAPVAGLLAVAASVVALGVLAATQRLAGLAPEPNLLPQWLGRAENLDPAGSAGVVESPDTAGQHAGAGDPVGAVLAGSPTPPARGFGMSSPTAYTVLGIGLVPWIMSVLTVLQGRSWWAAAAAASVLVVQAAMTFRRRPLPAGLRVLAAACLLPTAGILLINAGAMVIPRSGSPILLPIVAALTAGTAIGAAHAAAWIETIDPRAAVPARSAVEIGALLTAAVSVVLGAVLPAAGPSTTLVVCAILAAGAAVVAAQPDRRWVWWLMALATSGVLWSALVLLDVGLVEAYTLPLGVAAVIVGLALARRNPRWWSLVIAGLLLGLLPTWVLAATGRALLVRTQALTGVAVVLALSAGFVRRRRGGGFAWPLAGGLAVAGTAPLLVAVRSSGRVPATDPALVALLSHLDPSPLAGFAWVVALALISAVLLGVAGQLASWACAGSRRWCPVAASWRFAPALTVAAAGLMLAVRPGAAVVWAMWLACLVFLAVTLASTLLRLRGRVLLPPVWYCWGLALGVGIAGWSLRALRVEFHALPLGLILLGCGILAWRAAGRGEVPADRSWPIGESDPTRAILPGVLAVLGPSTLAIGTDPQTWRAILVLVLALAALLVGARLLWRPCLTVGIVDLGVAVGLVFVARRGAIDAVPWLIALVSAGGVLLGLAIYSERRQHAAKVEARPPGT